MKVMLDTNVLLSGLGFSGVCSDLLEELLYQGCELIETDYILEELREKVRSKLKGEQREKALDLLLFLLQRLPLKVKRFDEYSVNLSKVEGLVPEEDTPILAAAVQQEVDYFVTGDKIHFLENKGVRSLLKAKLKSPKEMLEVLSTRRAGA